MIRLSVVIPAYNAGQQLTEAVTSVGAGGRADVEVIVVDDGSTDGSLDGVRDLPGVRVLEQENRGPGAARNHGITAAQGEWIAFLDADDAWLETRAASLLDTARLDPAAGLYHCDWLLVPEGGEPTRVRTSLPPGPAPQSLILNNWIGTSTVVASRQRLAEAGGFFEEQRYAEDWDLWLRMAEISPVHHLGDVGVRRRERPDSLSMVDAQYAHTCQLRVVERATTRRPDLYRPVARRARANAHLRTGIRLHAAGQFGEAATMLGRALLLGRLRPSWKYLLWSLARRPAASE